MIVFWTIVQFTSICIIGRIFWRLWSFIWRLLEAASMLKGRGRGHQVHAQGWRHVLHIWALVNLKIRFEQWLFFGMCLKIILKILKNCVCFLKRSKLKLKEHSRSYGFHPFMPFFPCMVRSRDGPRPEIVVGRSGFYNFVGSV